MNKFKHIVYACLVLFWMPISGREGDVHTISPLKIKDIPRVNGELDFSKMDEVTFKSVEKTQLSGRFGIVAVRIEDLVNIPEFITFRPVVVIGKLTYRREGASYLCHIQWEKVCLLTPAFNKVKRLDKGLTSRFNHSGAEIAKDFMISARGDIPTFIKNVKELFAAPVSSAADLTEKEREKINELNKNQLNEGSPLGKGSTDSRGDANLKSLDLNKAGLAHSAEQSARASSHRNQEGETTSTSTTHGAKKGERVADQRGVEERNDSAQKEKDKNAATKKDKTTAYGHESMNSSRKDGDTPQVKVPGGKAQTDKTGGSKGKEQQADSTGDATKESSGQSEKSGADSSRPREPNHSKKDESSFSRGTGTQFSAEDDHIKTKKDTGQNRQGRRRDEDESDHAKFHNRSFPDASSANAGGAYGASTGDSRDASADSSSGDGDCMNVTTEGCSIRVDLDQLRAIQQERLIIKRNGREERSPCKDGSTVFTIHKDYEHPYKVDLRLGKAYPQYSYYYLDSTGKRKVVRIAGREIETDINNPVVLQETEEGCSPTQEYGRDSITMIKCKRKFYHKHSGEKEFATECSATEIKAKVDWTTNGCEVDHNFAKKQSFIQKRRVYTFPGDQAATEYSKCERENREPIAHKLEPCEPEVENGKWFERHRTEIKLNGRAIVIRPCERVSLSGKALEKEYTCTYSHLADKSHPYMRKYYTFNGNKQYVTGLEVDLTAVYPHVKRILSYENQDDTKQATPIEQYYFKGVDNREVDVRIAPGVPIRYVNTHETEIKTEGTPTYDGCHKITRQFKYLKWKRPDGSYYFERQNEEQPLREYVCQTEYVTEKRVLKTILRYKDAKYESVDRDGGITHGSNEMFCVQADGKKTFEEMKALAIKSYPGGRLRGSMTSFTLTYTSEESTYVVLKRNGVSVGSRTLQSSRTFDETVDIK